MSTVAAPVRRAVGLIFALQGQSFDGLRLAQLCTALGTTTSSTLRDLQALEALGITERIPGRDERWRLSPRLVQIAIAHQNELARLNARVSEFEQRYTRTPN